MRESNQKFSDDERRVLRVEGQFPGYISSLNSKEFDDGNEVFNIETKLAKDAADAIVPAFVYSEIHDKDGIARAPVMIPDPDNPGQEKQKLIKANHMAGQVIRDNGTWFYENASKEWQTNEKYADRMTAIGVEFGVTQIDGKPMTVLGKIDAEDVLGLPVIVTLGWRKWEQKDKVTKEVIKSGMALTVLEYQQWNNDDGEPMPRLTKKQLEDWLNEDENGETPPF